MDQANLQNDTRAMGVVGRKSGHKYCLKAGTERNNIWTL